VAQRITHSRSHHHRIAQEKDRDHFSQFVTEDFEAYVLRKRCLGVYANNPEIQALSEMLGRPIEVYSYASGAAPHLVSRAAAAAT
jgi:hypothetical protein